MRIRVLHILNELNPSGMETMLHAAAPLWSRFGVQCDILATGHESGPYRSTLERAGYRVFHLPFSRSPLFFIRLAMFIRKQDYHAVHVHPERANFWYSLTAKLVGVRQVIRTVHNVFPFRGLLRFRRFVQRWFMRNALNVTMVSISPSVTAVEWESFRNSTVIVANWYDSNRIVPPTASERAKARAAFGIGDDMFVVVTLGGCWEFKNHDGLIKALRLLPDTTPIVYLHVGKEAPNCSERALAADLGLSQRVRFLGILLDVLPVLHAADAYAMPSLWEGFGVAAVEAMGAALPVLLSDVPGLRDFRSTCPGILWTGTDPESIAAGLLKLIAMSHEERTHLGAQLRRAVLQHYSVERGARAYAQLYQVEQPA